MTNWLQKWFNLFGVRGKRRSGRRSSAPSRHLILEGLEDRTLLSHPTVGIGRRLDHSFPLIPDHPSPLILVRNAPNNLATHTNVVFSGRVAGRVGKVVSLEA